MKACNNDLQTLELQLLATDWFQRLNRNAKERVLYDCLERTLQAKESLGNRGDPAQWWYGVTEGLLKVCADTAGGKTVMFTAVPQGSWAGEGSVIKREPLHYDLIAMRRTRVILVPRATFMWLLESDASFSRYIIDHLNERVAQFIGMLEVSRIADPAARVAGAIAGLFNPVIYPMAGPLLNVSQEEIGELAGLSRPTANAAITKLRKMGLVRSEYGGLLVLDLQALRSYVQQNT